MVEPRPNILLLITDHHAYFDHYGEGPGRLDPPRWRQFCEEGVIFERAYSACPICSPARASMMTGQFPSAHGLRWNTEATHLCENRTDFRDDQRLYSHYLAAAGYRNAYIGKWHCGHEKLPVDYGIEGWSLPDYGKVYMSDAYKTYAAERGFGDARATIERDCIHPEREGKTFVLHHESPWHFMDASGVFLGPPEAHEQQFVAHLAIEKLRELARGAQPFSLVASFWGPHQPFYPCEPFASMFDPASIPENATFRDDYAGKPWRNLFHRDLKGNGPEPGRWDWSVWQQILARAYGQSMQLDAAIGSLLDTLDETGLADNTLVIWVADHGDAVASHAGLWDKASTCIEEVMRVPMAMRWPGRFGKNSIVDRFVSNMDVTATMLHAAGVRVPGDMHSRSLLGLCADPEKGDYPDHVICEHNGHGDVILQRVILYDRWKYVAAHLDGDELYDLNADPHERVNLINSREHADVLDMLRHRLIEHIQGTHDVPASQRLLYELKTLTHA